MWSLALLSHVLMELAMLGKLTMPRRFSSFMQSGGAESSPALFSKETSDLLRFAGIIQILVEQDFMSFNLTFPKCF